MSAPNEIRLLLCDFCSASFYEEEKLKVHISNEHQKNFDSMSPEPSTSRNSVKNEIQDDLQGTSWQIVKRDSALARI
jgi:hypothetical protein